MRSAATELHRLEAQLALTRAQATEAALRIMRLTEEISRLRLSLTKEDARQYEFLATVYELDRISAVRTCKPGATPQGSRDAKGPADKAVGLEAALRSAPSHGGDHGN